MDTSSNERQADLDWTVTLNRLGLKVIGLWPETNKTKTENLLKTTHRLIVFASLTLFLLIPEYCSLLRVWGNMLLTIDNLQTSLPITAGVVKFTILWWKNEAIYPVAYMVRNDWLKLKTVEERETMMKQAQTIRTITRAGYIMTISSATILSALPCSGLSVRYVTNFTDPGKVLPVQSYFLYDLTNSVNFELTFIGQTVSLLIVAMCYTGIDCFFAMLTLHICGQLATIKLHLNNLHLKVGNIPFELSCSVKEHIRLIRSVKIVDDTFNLMLLGQLIYFTVLFCFQGFLFIKLFKEDNEVSVPRLTWLIAVTLTVFIHMFLYCFVGECLMMQCEEIYNAAYGCKWYVLKPCETRMLILILVRARIPLRITAGKIFPMTMAMFCSVIKTSASYVSVLLAYT